MPSRQLVDGEPAGSDLQLRRLRLLSAKTLAGVLAALSRSRVESSTLPSSWMERPESSCVSTSLTNAGASWWPMLVKRCRNSRTGQVGRAGRAGRVSRTSRCR